MQQLRSWNDLFCGRSPTLLPIRALRRMVVARDCRAAAREFDRGMGDRAGEAFGLFQVFVILLGRAARRPLQVGYPGYFGLTPDEHSVLALFAAAGAGEEERLDAHLRWLALKDRRAELREIVCRFAGAMAGSVPIDIPLDDPLFAAACAP